MTRLGAVLALALWLAGNGPAAARDVIVEAKSGRTLDLAQLVDAVRRSDYALLGERHDNAEHHARRGELIRALDGRGSVVAEHLERGRHFAADEIAKGEENDRGGEVSDLEAALVAAGFDPKGWRWPLHRPLFAAAAAAGLPLAGGNVARELARRIAQEGEAAVPPELAALLARAPLGAQAQARQDADQIAGHCGMLTPERLPGHRLAQRTRDAAMAEALLAQTRKPALLLAGNGHVRLDYGVPTLLAQLAPGAKVVVVGFVESGEELADARRDGLYTHLWLGAPAAREDPCAALLKTGLPPAGGKPTSPQAPTQP